MNRLAVAALLLFPALADAQRAGAPPGTPDEIKRNLIRIEREIGQANVAGDYNRAHHDLRQERGQYFDQPSQPVHRCVCLA